MHHYAATVVSVYDGDTITVDVDLGFGVWLLKQKIRLYGIDAPEIRGEGKALGIKTRDWLRAQLWSGKKIELRTYKGTSGGDEKGKYGRWLAEVFCDGKNLNEEMLELGLAKRYEP